MTTPIMPLDCDGFAGALADYLEGEASDAVRSAVDAHAGACAACHQLLDDLSGMRVDAASLPPLVPARDLWAGIAERIDARVLPLDTARANLDIPRTRAWARPAIAAAALVVMTAGITHYLTRASLSGRAPVTQVASVAPPAEVSPVAVAADSSVAPVAPVIEPAATAGSPSVGRTFVAVRDAGRGGRSELAGTPLRLAGVKPAMSQVDSVFAGEITKLRRMLRVRRAELDPGTVAVLEQSIAVIDSAIAQSRAALAKDPASGFLATQLSHSLEKKIELLRTAALLPSRT